MTPLYENRDIPATLPKDGHMGLWWDKFFNLYQSGWKVNDGDKLNWIQTVSGQRNSKKNKEHLNKFVQRQMELGRALRASQNVFETQWHFATGLGLSHPVQNGFAWHPSLGMPYLPGSGVKGLLKAWVEEWMFEGNEQNAQKRDRIRCWFGSDEKDNEKAGDLIFFDAIPVELVKLAPDIVTPHMGMWYEKGDTINSLTGDASKVPADWHSPIPSPFLVVKEGRFLFQIASRGNTSPEEATAAMQQLQAALQWLGAGAKTAVGYGRMSENTEKIQELETLLAPNKPVIVPVVGIITKEEVMMVEAPQGNKVMIETGSGKTIQCSELPIEIEGEKPNADRVVFSANVRRDNDIILSATWAAWID